MMCMCRFTKIYYYLVFFFFLLDIADGAATVVFFLSRFPIFPVDFHKMLFHTKLALIITDGAKKNYSNRLSRF